MAGTYHPSDLSDEDAPRMSDELLLEVDLLTAQDTPPRSDARRDQAVRTGEIRLAILVIGSDQELRAYIRQCLERHNHPVDPILEAGTLEDALAAARSQPIDLVISDANLSGQDSYELCRALRADPAVGERPILLIVNEPFNRMVVERARRARVDAVLAQPFNAHKVCAMVEQLLMRK